MEFSRCARTRASAERESRPVAGLSKLNSVIDDEVDVLPGEPGHGRSALEREPAIDEPDAYRSKSSCIP
jgi:hypothetical protein